MDNSTLTEKEPAVVLEGIGKSFPAGGTDLSVLSGISLDIGKGEFVAVMGASGSGKTTLLNIIGGLLAPDRGAVAIDGAALKGMNDSRLTAFRREKIGFVFQMFNLVDSLTVSQNILLPLLATGGKLSAEARNRYEFLVEKTGLSSRLEHRPHQLSGGEQQRVAIARALVNNPAIVLADEPTGNLDSENTALLGDLFRELHQEEESSFLVVTHDAEVAMWADRLIVLKDGGIVSDRATDGFASAGDLASCYLELVSNT